MRICLCCQCKLNTFYTQVHNHEVDYTTRQSQMAAIVTGTEHHKFSWRLVSSKVITYDDCINRNEKCISYETTNKNSHLFRDLELKHSNK